MTTLPKLRIPQETGVSSLPTMPRSSPSAPKRSKTVIGMKTTSYSLDCNSKSSVVFPWLHPSTGYVEGQTKKPRPKPKSDVPRPKREKTFTLVSTEASFENEMRQLQKKRDQYHQFHNKWKRPFYGSKVEQEEYRKEIRGVLKDQMSMKLENHKQHQIDKVQESTQACDFDQDCLSKDTRARQEKVVYLMKFRDENKRAIEQRERMRYEDRVSDADLEQKLLEKNPVNWSQTLR